MQNFQPTKQPVDMRAVLDNSREVLIALGRNPTLDAVASGLSLYLALSSSGKRVSIVSPSQMTVEFNHLIGVDKISTNITNGGRNLVVSFPYAEGSIEKVSYNIENDIFNLVIEPREGYPTITPDKLSYSYGGGTFDTIFVVNTANFSELDSIYNQNQNLFSEKQIVNIDNNSTNQRFGKINFIDPNASTVSEMLTHLLGSWGLKLDVDIATNLLAGITAGSNNFTSTLSGVGAFEAATICLRNGARKVGGESNSVSTYSQSQSYQFPTKYSPSVPDTIQNAYQRQQPMNQSMQKPGPQIRPQPQPQRQPLPPMQKQQIKVQPQARQSLQPQGQQQKKQEAPPDWLKPKIYKGSTLL